MLDTRLCSLLKIVETGSYTRAAEALSLSQPAVSQHIRQLEETFGVKIFEYAHNKLSLTREGELIVGYARRMAALYSNLEQALKNAREEVRSLTIGITHTAESSVIIEALAGYVSVFDGLSIKILTNTTDNLYRILLTCRSSRIFARRACSSGLRFILLLLRKPPMSCSYSTPHRRFTQISG